MNELKERIKKYLLVKHTEAKLKECSEHISKNIPWIQRKSFSNTIETHCRVLLNSLINDYEKQSLRRNKYIVDSILKYNLEKIETVLKSGKKAKDLKSYMQLNSYIIFDEISKGISSNISKKTIKYNIEKKLSLIQEQIEAKNTPEEILNSAIGV